MAGTLQRSARHHRFGAGAVPLRGHAWAATGRRFALRTRNEPVAGSANHAVEPAAVGRQGGELAWPPELPGPGCPPCGGGGAAVADGHRCAQSAPVERPSARGAAATFLLLKTAKKGREHWPATAHRMAIKTSGPAPPWPSTVQPCSA